MSVGIKVCDKHGDSYGGYGSRFAECPGCVREERDRLRDACIKTFQQSENMIANVLQCDYRYYQGRMCAAENALRDAGYDHRGNRRPE